jgi:hypothetical protein
MLKFLLLVIGYWLIEFDDSLNYDLNIILEN